MTPYVVLLLGGAEMARLPLQEGRCPDLSVVDRLARLQLSALRLGCSIRLHNAPSGLLALIELAGLADMLTDRTAPAADAPSPYPARGTRSDKTAN